VAWEFSLDEGQVSTDSHHFERELRPPADHAGKSYPVEIANGRLPLFENASGYRHPTGIANRNSQSRVPDRMTAGTEPWRERFLARSPKMGNGWFGEFNFI
jgi:hypothetical protein